LVRRLLACCGLGLVSLWGAGCHSTNRSPAGPTQATAPAVPQDAASNTVSVDLNKSLDEVQFHKDVTQEQRVKTHLDLGRVFENQGNHEGALLEYQEALAASEQKGLGKTRSQDQALAHRRVAGSLDRLGRFAQAEMHYKKAISQAPKDYRVWNDAGYSYYLQGRWADAERALKAAERLAPEEPRIKTNLGLVLAAAGRPEAALPLLSQFSGDAIGHANLGYLLAATGQIELARQQYLQALAMRPNLEIARRALSRLDHAGDGQLVASAAPSAPRRAPAGLPPTSSDPQVRQTSAARTRIPPPRSFTVLAPPLPSLSLPSTGADERR
jgi:tetratricopeptide (TPR) repeat protein